MLIFLLGGRPLPGFLPRWHLWAPPTAFYPSLLSRTRPRYVSNFIAIHRLRPGDDEQDGLANPDDLLEDEEIHVTKDMLDDVLETRIGGKSKHVDDLEDLGDGHHMNSSEAIGLGRDVWSQPDASTVDAKQPVFVFDEQNIKQSLQSAKKSRAKETKFNDRTAGNTRAERESTLQHRPQATREEVEEWLQALKTMK